MGLGVLGDNVCAKIKMVDMEVHVIGLIVCLNLLFSLIAMCILLSHNKNGSY